MLFGRRLSVSAREQSETSCHPSYQLRRLDTLCCHALCCFLQVRDFQSVIGRETREQCQERWGGKPDIVIACVGGGSNAMGIFHEFVDDEDVRLIGVEAGGEGVTTSKHAATLTKGSPGVLHGSFSYLLQDSEGQVVDPHSISAG